MERAARLMLRRTTDRDQPAMRDGNPVGSETKNPPRRLGGFSTRREAAPFNSRHRKESNPQGARGKGEGAQG